MERGDCDLFQVEAHHEPERLTEAEEKFFG